MPLFVFYSSSDPEAYNSYYPIKMKVVAATLAAAQASPGVDLSWSYVQLADESLLAAYEPVEMWNVYSTGGSAYVDCSPLRKYAQYAKYPGANAGQISGIVIGYSMVGVLAVNDNATYSLMQLTDAQMTAMGSDVWMVVESGTGPTKTLSKVTDAVVAASITVRADGAFHPISVAGQTTFTGSAAQVGQTAEYQMATATAVEVMSLAPGTDVLRISRPYPLPDLDVTITYSSTAGITTATTGSAVKFVCQGPVFPTLEILNDGVMREVFDGLPAGSLVTATFPDGGDSVAYAALPSVQDVRAASVAVRSVIVVVRGPTPYPTFSRRVNVVSKFSAGVTAGPTGTAGLDIVVLPANADSNPTPTIASATSMDVGSIVGGNALVTGTTTIESLGARPNITRLLTFDQSLTIKHNPAAIVMPNAQDLVVLADDDIEVRSLGDGIFYLWNLWRLGAMKQLATSNVINIAANVDNWSINIGGYPSGEVTLLLPASEAGESAAGNFGTGKYVGEKVRVTVSATGTDYILLANPSFTLNGVVTGNNTFAYFYDKDSFTAAYVGGTTWDITDIRLNQNRQAAVGSVTVNGRLLMNIAPAFGFGATRFVYATFSSDNLRGFTPVPNARVSVYVAGFGTLTITPGPETRTPTGNPFTVPGGAYLDLESGDDGVWDVAVRAMLPLTLAQLRAGTNADRYATADTLDGYLTKAVAVRDPTDSASITSASAVVAAGNNAVLQQRRSGTQCLATIDFNARVTITGGGNGTASFFVAYYNGTSYVAVSSEGTDITSMQTGQTFSGTVSVILNDTHLNNNNWVVQLMVSVGNAATTAVVVRNRIIKLQELVQ